MASRLEARDVIVLSGGELVHPRCQVGAAAGPEFGGERLVMGGVCRQSVDQIVDTRPGVGRVGLLGEQGVEPLREPPVAFGHRPQQTGEVGFAVDVGLLGEVFGAGDRRTDVADPRPQRVHCVGAGRLGHRRYSRAPVPTALNVPAVLRGALVTLVIATPAVLVIRELGDTDDGTDQSNWVYLAFLFVIVAYVIGGWTAGRRAPEGPFLNGAAAPAAAFAVVQVIAWIASGDGISIVAAIFNLLLAATIGVVGAGFGSMRGTLVDGGGEPTG